MSEYSRASITGLVRYDPERCFNGYTLIPTHPGASTARGAALYDMNGRLVHRWEGMLGCFDNKLLPGGDILGTTAFMPGYWLDAMNLVQQDWDGVPRWSYAKGESLRDLQSGEMVPSARLHHDFQREGNPTGYYVPGMEARRSGITLLNSTRTCRLPELSRLPVADSQLKQIDENGNCFWSWSVIDHWDQLGVASCAKAVHFQCAPEFGSAGYVKSTYCNNVNWLGPNRWYDAGDERFHPANIISDIRNLNVSFIIDHRSGDIVWRLGPDFEADKKLQDIGQIVGQHHVHMIPRGLPGEGNILLFDNGGQAGLGAPSPCAPDGYYNATRAFSRILEIDPTTMEVVWSYNDRRRNHQNNYEATLTKNLLFSPYCSGADRLPNGNTLISEFLWGRVIEVTPEGEIVWEFVNPGGRVFRAHRYPYSWCDRLPRPREVPVTPLPNYRLRLNEKGEPVLAPEDDFFVQE